MTRFPRVRRWAKRLSLAATFLVALSLLSPVSPALVASLLRAMYGFDEPTPASDSYSGAALGQEFPQPSGFVNDFADVIPDDIRAKIEAIAVELEEKTGSELVVATVRTTGGIDIHDYSVELFTRWGIGKKGRDNGLLIVAAVDDRKLWVKTGYGLEETIPDAVASKIYRDVLRPSFRKGEYGEGLLLAVQAFAGRIASGAGIKLTSLEDASALSRTSEKRKGGGEFAPLLVIAVMTLLIMLRMLGSALPGKYGGFPFWTKGGFSGGMKGGGFGGGFGGFGGGRCGGGGAGGGW